MGVGLNVQEFPPPHKALDFCEVIIRKRRMDADVIADDLISEWISIHAV